jgi:DNA-binding MurR/RpiR family transcriptional regulator
VHGISLGGFSAPTAVRFLSELGVDGFFALSGF